MNASKKRLKESDIEDSGHDERLPTSGNPSVVLEEIERGTGDGEVLKSSRIAFSLFLSSVSNADMYAMPVLLVILSLARHFSSVSVINVSRQAVGAAHALAKSGLH
ncbi:hypothetical protein RHSIM_Rhsim12G0079900 [Rhododendron simsii]|uniref:Uncharacterized protein n=1 Tax=Rhododendron simsii TaxID=118357 RepID=A0A834G861_RHOSS|nr:hypothetical protein RHSIM_Rhsim12G0079900 [Rhododendron simsii]